MSTPPISRLQRVQIREIWQSEPRDFTPWLVTEENLTLLSEAIGIQLEVHSVEESVGEFRADIVCESRPEGDLVLVENQFGQTDHIHLGQILTYTAGLEAVTIVWISERFREEHRAAIDWLNEKTPECMTSSPSSTLARAGSLIINDLHKHNGFLALQFPISQGNSLDLSCSRWDSHTSGYKSILCLSD